MEVLEPGDTRTYPRIIRCEVSEEYQRGCNALLRIELTDLFTVVLVDRTYAAYICPECYERRFVDDAPEVLKHVLPGKKRWLEEHPDRLPKVE